MGKKLRTPWLVPLVQLEYERIPVLSHSTNEVLDTQHRRGEVEALHTRIGHTAQARGGGITHTLKIKPTRKKQKACNNSNGTVRRQVNVTHHTTCVVYVCGHQSATRFFSENCDRSTEHVVSRTTLVVTHWRICKHVDRHRPKLQSRLKICLRACTYTHTT